MAAGEEKNQRGSDIADLYLVDGSPSQINVSQRILKATLERLPQMPDDLFDDVTSEVFKLMKNDSYERFSQSIFFDAMISGQFLKIATFGEEHFLNFVTLCTERHETWTPFGKKKGEGGRIVLEKDCGGQLDTQIYFSYVSV